jgi:periplasmic divalent cation tolerance protein
VSKALVFLSTFASRSEAQAFAKKVVALRLAACVNVLPSVTSHYRWKNRVLKEKETLIIGKTSAAKFAQLKRRIKSLHPYEVPELIALSVADGFKTYLKWISDETQGK